MTDKASLIGRAMRMKVDEAERLLGLSGERYDETGVRLAYMRLRRKAGTRTARKDALDAHDTLQRYLTSRQRTGQVTYKERYQAKRRNAQTVVDMVFGKSHAPGAGGRDGTPGDDDPSLNLAGRWSAGHGGYVRMRDSLRPTSDARGSAHPFLKAMLMTLWDMTPWRLYLCFWATAIGVAAWTFETLMPSGALYPLNVIASLTFLAGLVDFVGPKTWKRAMRSSAVRIDRM